MTHPLDGPAKAPEQMVRDGDPATSTAAAGSVVEKLSAIRAVVFGHLQRAGKAGLTDWELEQVVGDHGPTYRSRRAELVEMGLVRDSGATRINEGSGSSNHRTVWIVVPEGERPSLQDQMVAKARANRLHDQVMVLLTEAERDYDRAIRELPTAVAAGDIGWAQSLLTKHIGPAHARVQEAFALLDTKGEDA